ncbi:XdhC/CoxI family protein [Cytobacillus sp. FSL M8-0252]|uniref:XdhC family protein n=1 Tax=Cytobacillus sp. FSL M8-0252 TaxID=2921621 RepID=UPI0030FA2D45
MDNIHQIFKASPTEGDVLATVIQVNGSAYRKEGTTMLIKQSGSTIGVLSGGCLEEDIKYRAETLIDGQSKSFLYNLKSEDDLGWGQGSGCNGEIRVLLEKIDASYQAHLEKVNEQLLQGRSILTVKKLSEDYEVIGYTVIVDDNNYWTKALNIDANMELKEMKSGIHYSKELSIYRYFQWFHPKPRLFILGAGEDGVPLCDFAHKTGFHVTVADWREALCSKERFPQADRLLIGFPHEVLPKALHPQDHIVIMTHHFERDKEILQYVLNRPFKYIGIIGSNRRTMRLLEGESVPSNVYTPVGLSIGAEGPEEIAISVMAQLIAVKQKVVTENGKQANCRTLVYTK